MRMVPVFALAAGQAPAAFPFADLFQRVADMIGRDFRIS